MKRTKKTKTGEVTRRNQDLNPNFARQMNPKNRGPWIRWACVCLCVLVWACLLGVLTGFRADGERAGMFITKVCWLFFGCDASNCQVRTFNIHLAFATCYTQNQNEMPYPETNMRSSPNKFLPACAQNQGTRLPSPSPHVARFMALWPRPRNVEYDRRNHLQSQTHNKSPTTNLASSVISSNVGICPLFWT